MDILCRLGHVDRRKILEPYVAEGVKTHGCAEGESIAHNGMKTYVVDIFRYLHSYESELDELIAKYGTWDYDSEWHKPLKKNHAREEEGRGQHRP